MRSKPHAVVERRDKESKMAMTTETSLAVFFFKHICLGEIWDFSLECLKIVKTWIFPFRLVLNLYTLYSASLYIVRQLNFLPFPVPCSFGLERGKRPKWGVSWRVSWTLATPWLKWFILVRGVYIYICFLPFSFLLNTNPGCSVPLVVTCCDISFNPAAKRTRSIIRAYQNMKITFYRFFEIIFGVFLFFSPDFGDHLWFVALLVECFNKSKLKVQDLILRSRLGLGRVRETLGCLVFRGPRGCFQGAFREGWRCAWVNFWLVGIRVWVGSCLSVIESWAPPKAGHFFTSWLLNVTKVSKTKRRFSIFFPCVLSKVAWGRQRLFNWAIQKPGRLLYTGDDKLHSWIGIISYKKPI